MASSVRELDHGTLRCEPGVLYLEIELDEHASETELAHMAGEIISQRLQRLRESGAVG